MSPIRLLVSVRDAAEADRAAAAGADIVDLKDPSGGALAPVTLAVVETATAAVGGRAPVSAVVAELPAPREVAESMIHGAAARGAATLKIGCGRARMTADDLRLVSLAASTARQVVVVFYAEATPDQRVLAAVAAAGAAGVMLDTQTKDGRTLLDIAPAAAIANFVDAARAAGLFTGLAGSLTIDDIDNVAEYGPAIVGMRGGLCLGNDRRQGLDPRRVRDARSRLAACPNPFAASHQRLSV